MNDDMDRKGEPFDAMAEHDKVIRHIEALAQKGGLSEAERADVETRVRTITERQKREIDRRIEEIRERYAPKPIKRTTAQNVAIATIIVALVGALLEMRIGEGFVFARADEYRAIATWVFAGLFPVTTIVTYHSLKGKEFSNSFLSRWIIKQFAFLIGALMLSGFIVMAPLGYMALAGVLMPGEHVEMDARVTSVERFSKSKHCDQRATLQVAWASAEICLENRVVGKIPRVNDEVVLRGKLTVFGIYIDEIESMDPGKRR